MTLFGIVEDTLADFEISILHVPAGGGGGGGSSTVTVVEHSTEPPGPVTVAV